MSFPRYPTYKESGVEWLGDVPENWTVGKLGYASKLRGGFAFSAVDFGTDGVVVVRMNNLKRGKLDLTDAARIPEVCCIESVALIEGDLVWGMSGSTGETGSLGNYARVRCEDLPCQLNQRVGRFVVDGSLHNVDFFEYLIQTTYFYEQVMLLVTGTAQYNVSSDQVQSCLVAFPPLDEQTQIAMFLDQETSKIDLLVGEQRRLIELLKEKRQAVISHAVTKGLNPNAPLKTSGIEWLGDVPEHWKVMRLKRITQYSRGITYGIVQPGESDPTGRFMIRGKDYSGGWCEADDIFRVSDAIEIPYARSRMRENDLIMTIVGAGVGNVAIIPGWLEGSNITQTSARIAIDPLVASPAYVCFALKGIIGQRNLERNVYGSAQPRLNIEHVDSYLMTIPPLAEQLAIVAILDTQLEKLDALTAEAERGIELLQERRTALISAAVTGKIDVRGQHEMESA